MMDFRENLQKCQGYIQALEEERRKIQVFQRELPLCLELITQAIEACKQQLSGASGTECFNGHSECTEQTTSDGPILEEFIPLKRSNSSDDDEELQFNKEEISNAQNHHEENHDNSDHKSGKKSDWLRSVQLWNQTPDPPTPQEEHQPKRVSVVEVKTNGAFQPFEKEKTTACDVNKPTLESAASSCSNAKAAAGAPTGGGGGGGGDGSGGKKEEKGGQSQRKSRRCWSPELHKRFLHALQQLGGSHVATPKQIRESMKVDGLTNDEVKSHLQKYRLHTRRPTPTTNNNNNNQQTPQFVVVGGIWMPPPEYASMATTSGETSPVSARNNIYAPVATMAPSLPQPQASTVVSQRKQQKQASQLHEERGSHSHGGVRSNSPSTSSSTHTTTASHSYN